VKLKYKAELLALSGELNADEYLRMSDAEDGYADGMTFKERCSVMSINRDIAFKADNNSPRYWLRWLLGEIRSLQ
jgi:hypothetical protein